MNIPHIHLLLNHVPTVGTVIAVAILILSFVRKNEGMRRVSLELFCVIALLTLPAYLSGVGTQLLLQERPDVAPTVMERHHDAALLASIFMVLTGGASWLGLWQLRRVDHPSRAAIGATMLFSVITLALMARAATLGGEIRHPEIMPAEIAASEAGTAQRSDAPQDVPFTSPGFEAPDQAEPPDVPFTSPGFEPSGQDAAPDVPFTSPGFGDRAGEPDAPAQDSDAVADAEAAAEDAEASPELTQPVAPWFSAASVAMFMTGKVWAWPAAEALHFVGLWLLFGIVVLINGRMLGLLRSVSFASLHRLLPWAVLGLGINIITGMLFVIGAPSQYTENVSFFWKIGLLLLAGLDTLYLTVFDTPWALRPGDDPPVIEKAMAAIAIVAWIGVMYFGRMLPFLGNAF
jgi:uncharacterized membrane protein